MIYFLENCDVGDRFIKAVGDSKLAELKPQLVDGSYIHMPMFVKNVRGQQRGEIQIHLENLVNIQN